jgi:DTW domain-containing protein YfiP
MRQRMTGLRGLPILSLAPIGAVARMRKSPGPGQVSTIEAIAAALRLLEGPEVADPLDRLFEMVVARVRKSGRPVHSRAPVDREPVQP